MAPGNADREPTLFEVLSISPRSLEGQDQASQAKIARQAYRRALLKHHPDRQAQRTDENAAATSDSSSASTDTSSQHFTVDQITEAYTVLSDAKKRREYTRTLRSRTRMTASSSGGNTKTKRRQRSRGPEVDTVELDHDMSWDGKRRLYYRGCDGCGKARGFTLGEDDIEDDSDEDYEMILECTGCDKGLRVLVPALADEDEAQVAQQDGSGLEALQSQMQDLASQVGRKEAEPPKKSRGWGFRLGLGLSLGGGASARAGR